MSDVRVFPTAQPCWGWYNGGILRGVEYSRRDAIKAVEDFTGKPWSKAKEYMEVHKVVVQALQDKP